MSLLSRIRAVSTSIGTIAPREGAPGDPPLRSGSVLNCWSRGVFWRTSSETATEETTTGPRRKTGAGVVAPVANDELIFPKGPTKKASVNDSDAATSSSSTLINGSDYNLNTGSSDTFGVAVELWSSESHAKAPKQGGAQYVSYSTD